MHAAHELLSQQRPEHHGCHRLPIADSTVPVTPDKGGTSNLLVARATAMEVVSQLANGFALLIRSGCHVASFAQCPQRLTALSGRTQLTMGLAAVLDCERSGPNDHTCME